MKMDALEANRAGKPSAFACPECNGVLWEVKDKELLRFRCRVGHAYSAESLLIAKSEELEGALWSALRALEESAAVSRRMADRAKKNGHDITHSKLTEHANEQEEQASVLRDMLVQGDIPRGHTEQEAAGTGTHG